MDPKELRGLCEAYSAIYDEDLRDELEEMSDEFAGIENLTNEEIDAIVEETIDEMLGEGYEFDEVEEIFEEVLSEAAKMDRAAARREYMRSSEKAAGEARKRGAAVVKKEKRAEKIAKVKGAVKSALGKAKEAAKSGASKAKSVARKAIDEPARKYAEKRGVVPSKSGKSTLGSGTGIQSVAYKQRTPEGRREVRAKVASDIKGRIKQKIGQAQVGAYSAARKTGQAASDVAGKTKQSVKNLAARTKRSVKGAVGKAARAVASGAGKVASRLGEEVDLYDLILSYLIQEGYVETLEEAEWMMANVIDKETINIIVEEMHDDEEDDEKKMKKKGKKSEDDEEDEEDEEDDDDLNEASYSAKKARAGEDIGKPGKMFSKIAKSAAKRYGSEERGKKVAGAILAKIRAKKG